MGFERVPARVRMAFSVDPRVSIRGKTKAIGLNPAAFELVGSPEKVELLYDEDSDRIALAPTDAAYGVNVRVAENKSGAKSYSVSSRALFQLANIPPANFDAAIALDDASGLYIIEVAPLRGMVPNGDAATEETAAKAK